MQASKFQCTKARQGCKLTKNDYYAKKVPENNNCCPLADATEGVTGFLENYWSVNRSLCP